MIYTYARHTPHLSCLVTETEQSLQDRNTALWSPSWRELSSSIKYLNSPHKRNFFFLQFLWFLCIDKIISFIIHFSPILFYSTLLYPVLLYSILFYPVLIKSSLFCYHILPCLYISFCLLTLMKFIDCIAIAIIRSLHHWIIGLSDFSVRFASFVPLLLCHRTMDI